MIQVQECLENWNCCQDCVKALSSRYYLGKHAEPLAHVVRFPVNAVNQIWHSIMMSTSNIGLQVVQLPFLLIDGIAVLALIIHQLMQVAKWEPLAHHVYHDDILIGPEYERVIIFMRLHPFPIGSLPLAAISG